MIDIEEFNQVFKSVSQNHYPSHLHSQIQAHEEQLGGELFFNLLLKTLNIPATHLYPPENAKKFRELHKTIATAKCQLHHKQSLLFYLLKDCAVVAKDKSENAATEFQRECALPNKYWLCMQGLWDLDNLNYQRAVLYLANPNLQPVFAEEILTTLLKADELTLALAYYSSVKPTLTSSELWDELFLAITTASITEAFFFIRKQPPTQHRHLLELLIHTTLNLPPGEEKKRKGLELIDLPFNSMEEIWFRDYLTIGRGRSLDRAGDTMLVRLLAQGNYDGTIDAIDTLTVSKSKIDGVKWDNILEGIKRGLGDRRGLENFAAGR